MKSIGRETLLNRIPKEYKLFIPREKELFTALDVLNLEGVSDELKISVVEITGFIHSDILNEFACRCAERALSRVENPDPRSVAAIEAKRAWLRGEITDAELDAAGDAAWAAAREHALYSSSAVLRAGALAAHGVAYRNDADYIAAECANMAIWAALEAAGEHSEGFAGDSDRYAAMDAACFAEQAWQVEELKKMLMGGGNVKRIRRKTLIDHVCREERKFIPEDKKTFTALDLLGMEGFPDSLKLTLALYDFDLIPKEVCNEFACRCAERALGNIKDPDPRSVAAIAAKRAWVQGKMTDAELQSAWDAAYNAVLDAARANSSDALYAAMDSAIIDARGSAWEASWHAACAAKDWEAERTWQMEALKKMLREAKA